MKGTAVGRSKTALGIIGTTAMVAGLAFWPGSLVAVVSPGLSPLPRKLPGLTVITASALPTVMEASLSGTSLHLDGWAGPKLASFSSTTPETRTSPPEGLVDSSLMRGSAPAPAQGRETIAESRQK